MSTQRSKVSLLLVITCMAIIQSISGMSLRSSNRIVVAGATGRVGSLVISELLSRENGTFVVRALVRDLEKAKKTLPVTSERLEIVKCDLGAKSDIAKACKDSDALIWCATGFSENSSPVDKFLALFKLKFTPKESIDVAALAQIGQIYSKKITEESISPQVLKSRVKLFWFCPKIVLPELICVLSILVTESQNSLALVSQCLYSRLFTLTCAT